MDILCTGLDAEGKQTSVREDEMAEAVKLLRSSLLFGKQTQVSLCTIRRSRNRRPCRFISLATTLRRSS